MSEPGRCNYIGVCKGDVSGGDPGRRKDLGVWGGGVSVSDPCRRIYLRTGGVFERPWMLHVYGRLHRSGLRD